MNRYQNILAHIPLIHGLIPPSALPDAAAAFLGRAWSISTEWQFYLIAPQAVAALLYHYVEAPAIGWARRKFRPSPVARP